MSTTTGNYDLPGVVVNLARENADLRAEVERISQVSGGYYDSSKAWMARAERAEAALGQLRQWLTDGASLQIADPTRPVLAWRPDGSLSGNLCVTMPPKP